MRLLHICAVDTTIEHLLRPQIDHFRSRGMTVEVACSPGPAVEDLRRRGYVIHEVAIPRQIRPVANARSVRGLLRVLTRGQYDVVHVHTPVASVLGRIAAALASTPRIVYTAHGFYFHDRMRPATYRFYHTIERWAARLTDLILTQSREDTETASRSGICPPEKVRYLGNGVDVDRFHPGLAPDAARAARRYELAIPEGAFPLLGVTGRITGEKGYLELVDALAMLRPEFPAARLLVIGGRLSSERDKFEATFERRVQAHRLERAVTFAGFRNDVRELLALLDVFVLPSHREGMPRSILEAMAMYLPVVTTDVRGCREAVVPEETGLIVPPGDAGSLAYAIGRLARDAGARTAFGLRGRTRVVTAFDERFVFRRLEAAYEELGWVPSREGSTNVPGLGSYRAARSTLLPQ